MGSLCPVVGCLPYHDVVDVKCVLWIPVRYDQVHDVGDGLWKHLEAVSPGRMRGLLLGLHLGRRWLGGPPAPWVGWYVLKDVKRLATYRNWTTMIMSTIQSCAKRCHLGDEGSLGWWSVEVDGLVVLLDNELVDCVSNLAQDHLHDLGFLFHLGELSDQVVVGFLELLREGVDLARHLVHHRVHVGPGCLVLLIKGF